MNFAEVVERSGDGKVALQGDRKGRVNGSGPGHSQKPVAERNVTVLGQVLPLPAKEFRIRNQNQNQNQKYGQSSE